MSYVVKTVHGRPFDGPGKGVWITLEFSRRQKEQITAYFKQFCRNWFWQMYVRRNPDSFLKSVKITGKTKTFVVTHESMAKYSIREA